MAIRHWYYWHWLWHSALACGFGIGIGIGIGIDFGIGFDIDFDIDFGFFFGFGRIPHWCLRSFLGLASENVRLAAGTLKHIPTAIAFGFAFAFAFRTCVRSGLCIRFALATLLLNHTGSKKQLTQTIIKKATIKVGRL